MLHYLVRQKNDNKNDCNARRRCCTSRTTRSLLHYLVRQKTTTKTTVTQEEVLYKQNYTLLASLSGETNNDNKNDCNARRGACTSRTTRSSLLHYLVRRTTTTKTTVTQEEVLYKQNYTLIASLSGETNNDNKNDCNARRGAVQAELHAHCFTIW